MENWIYEIDFNNRVRYSLGIEGEKTVLCFGINPSVAEPGNLDNTMQSVDRIIRHNGFDSWIMFNIYPQRATNPDDIHKRMNRKYHEGNLREIEKTVLELKKKDEEIVIWAAWGVLIEKRKFLKRLLLDIDNLLKDYNCTWVSIGETKAGHPKHPLYKKSTSDFYNFNMKEYIQDIESK